MQRKAVIFSTGCMLALLVFTACSQNGSSGGSSPTAQQESLSQRLIGTLHITAYGPDYVTLAHQGAADSSQSGTTSRDIQAYLGINGKIAVRDGAVENALAGPVDLASGSCTFRNLDPFQSYRIIVMAQGDDGTAVKYINPVRPEYAEINPADYLEMSEEEFGQLKSTLKLADDELDDFSRIESLNIYGIPLTGALQLGFCSYRYSIAFATYFLATEQYHKIPACQDIIKPRMDRLIQKMQQGPVWQYWAITSTGIYTFPFGENFGENSQIFYESERDPVRIRNIMYSGHLAEMIALYEKLYGDMKWSQPGAIVFKWSDTEKYTYDNNTLQKLLRDAFIDLPDHCIECEPNLCFLECNQHPILALKVYDQVHGTHLYEDSKDVLMDWVIKNNMIDPLSHDTSSVYLPMLDKTLGPDTWDIGNILSVLSVPLTDMINFRLAFAAADAWSGAFMHAWQPEYIAGHYPYQKEHRISSTTGKMKQDYIADQLAVGFFAMYAGELGDSETKDNLIAQCDDLYEPVWEDDGSYTYPVGNYDIVLNPTPYFTHYANSVTAFLVGIARGNPKDGLLKLHGEPFPGASGPVVKDVDIDKAKLLRAVYDSERDVLVISMDAGALAQSGDAEMFKVERLDPARTWHLKIDGKEERTCEGVSAMLIEVPLTGRHDIILAAE